MGLDVTLRRLAQSRRLPVLLVDCGLTDEGRRAAALLSDMNTKLLTPQELAAYYTEEDTAEQGRLADGRARDRGGHRRERHLS